MVAIIGLRFGRREWGCNIDPAKVVIKIFRESMPEFLMTRRAAMDGFAALDRARTRRLHIYEKFNSLHGALLSFAT